MHGVCTCMDGIGQMISILCRWLHHEYLSSEVSMTGKCSGLVSSVVPVWNQKENNYQDEFSSDF